MNIREQFSRVDAWRAALGLLPIPLRDGDVGTRFALLNGSVGNFCLDFADDTARSLRATAAWSSDVGHYVTISGDRILVTRWDRPGLEETYSASSVYTKIHEFHRHLEKEAPSRGSSVVAHVLQVFRKIRSMITEDQDGQRALQVLLHLLASAAAKVDRIETEPERWGLSLTALAASQNAISSARWDSLQLDLCGVGQFDSLVPDVSLILRHASGAVFEEAHRATILSNNLWLPGLERPSLVDKRSQADLGVFFTPAALARTLAEEGISKLINSETVGLNIFDPACGSGELLRESLRLLRMSGYTGTINLTGWDVSPSATQLANFILQWEQRSWSQFPANIDIKLQDSLDQAVWPTDVDLLIMNPPFLGWTKMTDLQKQQSVQILGSKQLNRPNLAMLFIYKAIDSVRDGGVLATIAPNSLLESSSSKILRGDLSLAFAPKLIARLGSQNIFADALVDASLYIGVKTEDKVQDAVVLWSDAQPTSLSHALRGLRKWNTTESDTVIFPNFSIYRRQDIGRSTASWVAREYTAWQFFKLLSGSRKTVPARRMFNIRQGVRMGADAFIVTREYYQRLSDREKIYFRPAVMNPSIQDGKLTDSHFIFYPYTEGILPIETEAQLIAQVPQFSKEILVPLKEKLRLRKSLRDNPWWALSEHRGWLEQKTPKIVSKYFGGEGAFAFDQSGDFVVVVGNAWTLNKELLQETNLTTEELYLGMLAFLNSSIFGSLLKYSSVQVAGGQMDLSNRYVDNIPIPTPAKMNTPVFLELVELGRQMSQGKLKSWTAVNNFVTKLVVTS